MVKYIFVVTIVSSLVLLIFNILEIIWVHGNDFEFETEWCFQS